MTSYAIQFPDGDLAKRFGWNSNLGLDFAYKLKNNWILGINGSFIFGGTIRETHMFDSIVTSQGYVINTDGKYTDLRLYERGFTVSLTGGKVFPVWGPNKNSGFLIRGGLGFLQHNIRIETTGNLAPQLGPDYRKGYDRLTNGLMLSQFIGYLYLSNNRLFNFYCGFELMEAFTENRRTVNFDTGKHDGTKRFDALEGFRVGFILPLYKRDISNYYY